MTSSALLFLLGLAAGSFLNVVALRYREGGRLFTADVLTGRSHCPHCREVLRWHELVPLFSFLFQFGRCRHCHKKISWQYPVVELLGGLAFLVIPQIAALPAIWVPAALTLILVSLIDLRLSVIPDQLNWFLALLGLAAILAQGIGSFALWEEKIWGLAAPVALFGLVILLSRGRAMGLGDLKLGAALGFLFGWPKIAVLIAIAFAVGGLVSVPILLFGKKSLKDAVPFGPFLALAAVLVIFFGDYIINRYATYFQIYF